MTKVSVILQTVKSSVDFGYVRHYAGADEDEQRTNFWKDVIAYKASDDGFGPLVESILRDGFHDDSAVGWDDGDKDITEGHHRLVAAILLGMDEIPTTSLGKSGKSPICAHGGNGHTVDYGISVFT